MIKMLGLILMIMSGACVTSGVSVEPEHTQAASIECNTYCHGPGTLLYRNERTYFCECAGGEIVVVSKTGTIYK